MSPARRRFLRACFALATVGGAAQAFRLWSRLGLPRDAEVAAHARVPDASFAEPALVYHPAYDIGFFGLERLHPFDTRRPGGAWRALDGRMAPALRKAWWAPAAPAREDDLLLVHRPAYLESLRSSRVVANAAELAPLKFLPQWVVDAQLLDPMRWATAGTILAARLALQTGLAVNLAGGFHHAKPERGEGFCIYNDIAIAVARLRADGRLGADDRVGYVDLDVHQGNGVSHCFMGDHRVVALDMFNADIYPAYDRAARARIDLVVRVHSGCDGPEYLEALHAELPRFLDELQKGPGVRLVVYNAGNDVYREDLLGQLLLEEEEIVARDRFVIDALVERKIPTLVVPSGGYSSRSRYILAALAGHVLGARPS